MPAKATHSPFAGTPHAFYNQILNSLLSTTATSQFDADLRQMLMLSRTENSATVALLSLILQYDYPSGSLCSHQVKIRQPSRYEMPHVLAIVSSHIA